MLIVISPEYIAGLFDGEGTVHYRGKQIIIAQLWNNDRNVLESIARTTGEMGIKSKLYAFSEGDKPHRDKFLLVYATRNAHKFLKFIEPFVKIKKEHVKVALEFYDDFKRLKGSEAERQAELERRKSIKQRLRLLNNPPVHVNQTRTASGHRRFDIAQKGGEESG